MRKYNTEKEIFQRLYGCNIFDENIFIDATCMLKLRVINLSYLKKLQGCESFYATDPSLSAMK